MENFTLRILQKGRNDMAQYCRYCGNMVWGDSFYCEEKNKCFAESTVKSANKCKKFELNPFDVMDIDKEYKPRKQKHDMQGQMSIADMERQG